MGGKCLRTIGLARARTVIGLKVIAHNLMHLARLQLETGQTTHAIGILDGVLKLKPGHPVAKRLKESLK